jgi:two-component system sensor histidine kinase KdpD
VDVPAGPDLLVLRGRVLEADDQRLLGAFAAQVAVVVDRIRLSAAADAAGVLAEGNKMRTALLAAVGHDLRTPLAAAKAAVSSLVSPDPRLDPDDRHELVVTADESLDKLASLVDDLLDMSRLQAGAMSVDRQSFAVEDVLVRCLDDLGPDGARVRVDPVDGLPPAMGDPAFLERVLVNLLANALRYSAPEAPPRVTCSRLGEHIQIRVVDRGPGIPVAARDRVFLPFQRLGDTDNSTGVGLGLALSRGLTEAMGGSLDPEETPGGGLTMVVSLPAGAEDEDTAPGRRERQQAGS